MSFPKITIITPQFEREKGAPTPACPPSEPSDWSALESMTKTELQEMGLRPWCEVGDEDWPHDRVLMLFPGEWYDHIPDGMPLVNIWGKHETFSDGVSDDDIRFGCLPYGVLAAKEKAH